LVNINIEIPEELHRKIKLASITQDLKLKDYVIKVLEKKAKECKAKV
jgi:predicted HicB family RNase H-like nuclease